MSIIVPATLGLTLGLIVFVLSAYRTRKEPNAAVIRRGGMTALLVYAIIAAPVLARTGLTLLGLLISIVFLALPLAATTMAQRYGESTAPPSAAVRAIVGTGLAAFTLIAAGQTIALVAGLDPRAVVLAVAVMAALVVCGQGLAGTSRAGSIALWLTILPILICLALGLGLGSASELIPPLIETATPPVGQIVALGVAFLALGWADHGLAALHVAGQWGTRWSLVARVFLGTAVIVVLIGLGLLMFLGGAILAPSLQFFVVPANLDILPIAVVLLMAIAATLFTAMVAVILGGVGALGGEGGLTISIRWVVVSAAVAAAIALVNPASDHVVVVASLAGAALLGADLGRGNTVKAIVVGLPLALVAAVVMGLTGSLDFGWTTVLAAAVVAVVAAATARVTAAREDTTQPQPVS